VIGLAYHGRVRNGQSQSVPDLSSYRELVLGLLSVDYIRPKWPMPLPSGR
jgi:hypothetical protein